MRRLTLSLALLLAAACSKGGEVTTGTPDAGTDAGFDAGLPPVEEPDAGTPVDAGPALAPGFGPFTGTFDVNGAGLLLAVQVDNHLALQVNGQPNLYLGRADAGFVDGGTPDGGLADGGHGRISVPVVRFGTELAYPDLETCGAPVDVVGVFLLDQDGYAATNDFCSGGQSASGPLEGQRLVGSAYYKQDLRLSGVYDLKESPGASNTCASTSAGPYKLTLGVSLGRDGGPGMILAAGDGILDEAYFGSVTSGGQLLATAQDPLGRPTSSLSLREVPDGGYVGSRTFRLGDASSSCVADFVLRGTRR